jgi:hypothetical protein
MQHRFAAKPMFSKTGKGSLISEGVADSPAFGQFGFRLEKSRTGLHWSSGWKKIGENAVDPGRLGKGTKRKRQ